MDASTAEKILSPLTLALLEDSGWYRVDFSRAGALRFGAGAGCSFVEDDCIDAAQNSTVTPGSRNIFCDLSNELSNDGAYVGCDPTHQYKAECEFVQSVTNIIPDDYQYFPDEPLLAGDNAQFDYCPRLTRWMVSCEGKMCFKQVQQESRPPADSVCLEAECDDGEVEFTYEGEKYKCSEDFEEIEIVVDPDDETMNFKVECPRLSAVCPELACPAACSGRGECEDDGKKIECSCAKEFKSDGCFLDLEAPEREGEDKGKKDKDKKKGE